MNTGLAAHLIGVAAQVETWRDHTRFYETDLHHLICVVPKCLNDWPGGSIFRDGEVKELAARLNSAIVEVFETFRREKLKLAADAISP